MGVGGGSRLPHLTSRLTGTAGPPGLVGTPAPTPSPVVAPGAPNPVAVAIAQVRTANGLNCQTCAIGLERALPGGRVRPISGEGLIHEVYLYQGKVLDPTARQYVKPSKAGVWTEEELARAGLKDAVDSGVFTPEQHGQFLKKLNERFPGVWED